MSKMGSMILEIQELFYLGIPSEAISNHTNTSVEFVEQVIEDMLKFEEGVSEYV